MGASSTTAGASPSGSACESVDQTATNLSREAACECGHDQSELLARAGMYQAGRLCNETSNELDDQTTRPGDCPIRDVPTQFFFGVRRSIPVVKISFPP
jgi:hypothetical protein